MGPKKGRKFLEEAVYPVLRDSLSTFIWNVDTIVPYSSNVDLDQRKLFSSASDWASRHQSKELFQEAPRYVIEAVRKAGIQGFIGFRVNDPHDRKYPHLRNVIKLDHPEYMQGGGFGPLAEALSFEGVRSSALDFALPEVRKYKLSQLETLVKKYPLDGLFLDFFRHPWLFAPKDMERGWDLLAGFMEEVRELLGDKPLWARVPADLSICRWCGIDLRAWVDRGLVDTVITGGGNVIFEQPADDLVAYCHERDVKVLLCIDAGLARHSFARQRAAHARGLDGVYMFNLFIPCRDNKPLGEPYDFSVLDELSDISQLDVMSKTYAVEEKALRPVNTHAEPMARVTFQITMANAQDGYGLPMFIGDTFADRDRLTNATLTLEMKDLALGDDLVAVALNGHELTPSADGSTSPGSNSREGTYIFEVARLLRSGENEITLYLRRRVPNIVTNITVTKVELELKYSN